MKSWYKVINDIELLNGSTIKEYRLVFLTADKELSKEVEAFFESVMDRAEQVEPAELHDDGTLIVKVADATRVGRVLVEDSHHWGGLYYPDE